MFEYLIIAVDESDIVGYYLLTDAAQANADKCSDYWEFVSNPRRKGMKEFGSIDQLIPFMVANGVQLKGEWGCTTY